MSPCDVESTVHLHVRRVAVLVLVAVLVIGVVVVGLLLTREPRTARIVDCAHGYHNIAGADSDCVPNGPAPPHPS